MIEEIPTGQNPEQVPTEEDFLKLQARLNSCIEELRLLNDWLFDASKNPSLQEQIPDARNKQAEVKELLERNLQAYKNQLHILEGAIVLCEDMTKNKKEAEKLRAIKKEAEEWLAKFE